MKNTSAPIIRPVKNKKDLRQFIQLPYRIHKDHKEWLPPILSDEWKVFDPKKNPAFDHCETILMLAEENGKVIGRVMGIINKAYNEAQHEKNGRFCYLECYEDKKVFLALLHAVEAWALSLGMENLIGPLGFSDKDPQGFLLEGFHDPMTVLITNHSYSYMLRFMENAGYIKKLDLVQYRLPTPDPLPKVYEKIAERALSRGYRIQEFKSTRKARPYIIPVFNLVNETYKDIYGFSPLTDREAKEFSERFLPILNANFIKLIFEGDELIAFVIAMPDLSKGLRISKGKLYPFGFIPVLWSMKRTKQLNMLLGCVKENKRNIGLEAVMAVKLLASAQKAGFTCIDTHLVMEENIKMRAVYERVGAEIYKKYRIFTKPLGRN